MAQFDRQIKTAIKLILKNGVAAKWRIIDDPVTDEELTPWKPGAYTPEDKDVVICFLPVSTQAMQSFNFINGTDVPKGSTMGLMGNVDFEPNLKDVVIYDGKQLRIASIDLLSPNGQKILYTVIFKQ